MVTTLKRKVEISHFNGVEYMFNKVKLNKKLIAVQRAE